MMNSSATNGGQSLERIYSSNRLFVLLNVLILKKHDE